MKLKLNHIRMMALEMNKPDMELHRLVFDDRNFARSLALWAASYAFYISETYKTPNDPEKILCTISIRAILLYDHKN